MLRVGGRNDARQMPKIPPSGGSHLRVSPSHEQNQYLMGQYLHPKRAPGHPPPRPARGLLKRRKLCEIDAVSAGVSAENSAQVPRHKISLILRRKFARDSPLEKGVSCELVLWKPNSLLAAKIQGISGILAQMGPRNFAVVMRFGFLAAAVLSRLRCGIA
jgi:hypothetical protein